MLDWVLNAPLKSSFWQIKFTFKIVKFQSFVFITFFLALSSSLKISPCMKLLFWYSCKRHLVQRNMFFSKWTFLIKKQINIDKKFGQFTSKPQLTYHVYMFICADDVICIETQFNCSKLSNFISSWKMVKNTIIICTRLTEARWVLYICYHNICPSAWVSTKPLWYTICRFYNKYIFIYINQIVSKFWFLSNIIKNV